jgi:hypothetical protein
MKNNNWIADFVANSMDAALKSDEYKTLFGTQYKTAGEKCAKCHKDHEDCMCDSSMADDQDAKKSKDSKDSSKADDNAAKKKDSKDSSSADDQDAKKKKDSKDSSMADDDDNDGNDPATGATVSNQGAKIEFPADSIKGPKASKPAHASDSNSANSLDSSFKNPYPSQYDADEYRNADVLRADDSEERVSSAYNVAIDSLLVASAALDSVGLGQGSAISLKLASLVVEAKKKEKDSKKDSKKSSKDSNSAKDKKKDSKDSKDSKKDSHSAKDKKSDKSSSSSKDSKDSKDSKKSSKK